MECWEIERESFLESLGKNYTLTRAVNILVDFPWSFFQSFLQSIFKKSQNKTEEMWEVRQPHRSGNSTVVSWSAVRGFLNAGRSRPLAPAKNALGPENYTSEANATILWGIPQTHAGKLFLWSIGASWTSWISQRAIRIRFSHRKKQEVCITAAVNPL